MILLAGAKNCAELYNAGVRSNGVYLIDPDGSGDFHVYCDQTTSGGGWMCSRRGWTALLTSIAPGTVTNMALVIQIASFGSDWSQYAA